MNSLGTLEQLEQEAKSEHIVCVTIRKIDFEVFYCRKDGVHDYYLVQENKYGHFVVILMAETIENIYNHLAKIINNTNDFCNFRVTSNDN